MMPGIPNFVRVLSIRCRPKIAVCVPPSIESRSSSISAFRPLNVARDATVSKSYGLVNPFYRMVPMLDLLPPADITERPQPGEAHDQEGDEPASQPGPIPWR
jgi:hypothetical protein